MEVRKGGITNKEKHISAYNRMLNRKEIRKQKYAQKNARNDVRRKGLSKEVRITKNLCL